MLDAFLFHPKKSKNYKHCMKLIDKYGAVEGGKKVWEFLDSLSIEEANRLVEESTLHMTDIVMQQQIFKFWKEQESQMIALGFSRN